MDRGIFFRNSHGDIARAMIRGKFAYGASSFEYVNIPNPSYVIPSKFSHRLPKTEINYIHKMPFVEEVSIPEYRRASDEANEDFLDMKFGMRLHWGIYSNW